jgi:hypothetical protein
MSQACAKAFRIAADVPARVRRESSSCKSLKGDGYRIPTASG